MNLVLRSETAEGLEQARDYLTATAGEAALTRIEEGNSNNDRVAEYEVDLADEKCESLLNDLLVSFPELDIYGRIISDVEGRDRSFWSTTTYQSSTNSSGDRVFEVSSSTHWA